MMQPQTEDQFAAALAHQLKTPVAALQAAAANLRRNLRGLVEDLASSSSSEDPVTPTAEFIARAVSEAAPPPTMGLLPKDRLDVIVRRLADSEVRGDLAAMAGCLLRALADELEQEGIHVVPSTTYLEEIVPLLRCDPDRTLDLLETSARLRANLGAIEASLGRIRGLSSALRLLARPVAGDPIELMPNIEASVSLVRATLPSTVRLASRCEGATRVRARAELLSEVWTNLLSNAAQAVGETGSIDVKVGTAAGGQCSITITDDGPGIRPEVCPRIFEPFFTTRADTGGTGLGLALAKRIVEGVGGKISVDSCPGRTTFAVTLPAVQEG